MPAVVAGDGEVVSGGGRRLEGMGLGLASVGVDEASVVESVVSFFFLVDFALALLASAIMAATFSMRVFRACAWSALY